MMEKANILRMLACRGHTVLEEAHGGRLIRTDKCMLFMAGPAKINLAYVSALLRYLYRETACAGTPHAIVVHDCPANATVRNLASTLRHVARIELFQAAFFRFALPDHSLVPRHSAAAPNEVRALGGDCKNLPRLRESDVVARYYDFRPGQVVRVDRADGTTVFRLVE